MQKFFLFSIVSIFVLSLAISGCRKDRQPDPLPEAEAEELAQEVVQEEPPPPQEEPAPMCGGWVVVVEQPTVSGRLDGSRVMSALMDGLRAGGCDVHTSRPARLPAGTQVVQLAPRLQDMGAGASNLSVIATDAGTGAVHSRHQERIPSGDGTAEARRLGDKIAQRLSQ